ncbi:MAG: hypothetical protein ACOC1K_05280 [Nanoarchaeota archaeon]
MTRKEVFQSFKSLYDCEECGNNLLLEEFQKDKIAVCESFNDYTDMLCKEGLISEGMYDNIRLSDFIN